MTTPPFNDYLVFADEAGDHSLSPLDKDFPLFVLAFCVVERYHYADFIVPQMLRLKLKYFPDPHVILHERDIRKGEGDFTFLTDRVVRQEFFDDLNGFVEKAQFNIIAGVVRKEVLANIDGTKDIYDMGVALGLKRLSILSKLQKLAHKITPPPMTIAFEARGKKEDAELRASFLQRVQHPQHLGRFNLKILPKVSNCCGLQLADLVARPIGRHLLKPDQPNKAYDIIREKMGNPEGDIIYGLQIF